jgi:hypothetical protein
MAILALVMTQWNCRRCLDKNFLIECACGCGSIITRSNRYGTERRCIHAHAAILNLRKIKTHLSGESHYAWKGGKIYDPHGYILVRRPNHPYAKINGYIFEHRLVMEKHLGRYLTQEEVVHHNNHVRDDNRIENLQLINRSEHTSRYHNDINIGRRNSMEVRTRMSVVHKRRMKNGVYRRDGLTGRFLKRTGG